KEVTITPYEVTINTNYKENDYTIILLADLHLGYNTSIPMIQKIVKMIDKEKPDFIFYAGDIFDNDYDSIMDIKKIQEEFKKLATNYKSYAVFGNHDIKERLFGGFSVQDLNENYRDPRMEE